MLIKLEGVYGTRLANLWQNKNKTKKGQLPSEMMETGYYHASLTTEDVWICYPWEAKYVAIWQSPKWLTLIANIVTGISTNMTGCPGRTRSLNYTGYHLLYRYLVLEPFRMHIGVGLFCHKSVKTSCSLWLLK